MTAGAVGQGEAQDQGSRRRRTARDVGWGFAAQGAASAVTLVLSVTAARAAGAAGLGEVFVGLTAALLAIGLLRALIVDPLLATSADAVARQHSAGCALTGALALGAGAALVLALVGELAAGPVGRGLVLFVPWVLPALVQELARSLLFQRGRGRAAAMTDALRLGLVVLLAPAAVAHGGTTAAVAPWGVGTTAAAVAALLVLRVRPHRLRAAFRWWQQEASHLARWLTGASVVYSIGSQVLVVVLVAVTGAAALGGLRAAQSLFAPLSLLGPALALPGLPAVVGRLAEGRTPAVRLAVVLSAAAVSMTLVYVLVIGLVGQAVVPGLFGADFSRYSALLVPVAVGQLLVAPALGAELMLKAERRGARLLVQQSVVATVSIGLVVLLGRSHGIEGAAWALAAAAAFGTAVVVRPALRGVTTRSS